MSDESAIRADPKLITQGLNNELIKNVAFEFGQADYNVAYMVLTDAEKGRYSIPESMARKPVSNPTMRLDMCGFEMFNEPFGFQFTKMWKGADKANVVLSSKDSAFIMYDKYI